MKILPLTLLATLLLWAGLPAAQAQTKTFRCKNDLVNLGDPKSSALLKCGEPLLKDSYCSGLASPIVTPYPQQWPHPVQPQVRPPVVVHRSACVTVDEWTYNPGYGQFMTTLRFESGQLAEITYGDRVK